MRDEQVALLAYAIQIIEIGVGNGRLKKLWMGEFSNDLDSNNRID